MIFDITLDIYRSVFEWVSLNSKTEERIRFCDIECIKIYNNRVIKLETYNKIDLNIIPKKLFHLIDIVNKLKDNYKNFIGCDLKIEEHKTLNTVQNLIFPKNQTFIFENINRILYSNIKQKTILCADAGFISEVYENEDRTINKINKIPLEDILFLILYETNPNYLEIVLKTNARFLYQTFSEVTNAELQLNQIDQTSTKTEKAKKYTLNDRNIIITSIIDLISNLNNKDLSSILLLSSKPKFGLRILGFPNNEVDWEYEKHLFIELYNKIKEEIERDIILEDISLNFCFKSEKFRTEVINTKAIQSIYDIFSSELSKLKQGIEKLELLSKQIYILNICLIVIKNLISKFHYDKLITDIASNLETLKYETISYNCISIFNSLIFKQEKYKKDEIAQRKWLIFSHFENGSKVKSLLLHKVFLNKIKIKDFEETSVKF